MTRDESLQIIRDAISSILPLISSILPSIPSILPLIRPIPGSIPRIVGRSRRVRIRSGTHDGGGVCRLPIGLVPRSPRGRRCGSRGNETH
jgi:hypothetical protein